MFHFDRLNPNVLFMDNRNESHTLCDGRTLTVAPDLVGDFTRTEFADESFHLVIFDPPHLLRAGVNGWQAKKYGRLDADWQDLLRRGFAECFRVLKTNGTLIFKWHEHDIPVSRILALTPRKPVVGNKCGKQNKTHWLVFFKE
jgi:predicted methyltransferase